ncbi:MAG TPA: TetR/AcrR family transcriptional regulator [Thiotrichales bacterium]|nr:MAG: hypothetical protein B7Y68_05710 [Thiotrichales bacterium 35-46-9]HQR81626.1 TetR/AcrR family transcriptional regulator [Thiotrichales bacterium]HQR95766.1 TetR/AcrR family transcriptional regulator [Thiotrichales bacterium]
MSIDKYAQIILAAKVAFEDKGYRVSMADIARRAGVAKQTLYNYFDNKEALFAAVIVDCGAEAHAILDDATLALPDKLSAFAQAFRRVSMSAQGIAGYRAMTAEAHQFPELAASFYHQGVGFLHQHTQRWLAEMNATGQLHCPDTALAADMLFSMLTGFERSRLLLGVAHECDGDASRVAPIVHAFLKAFAPETHSF